MVTICCRSVVKSVNILYIVEVLLYTPKGQDHDYRGFLVMFLECAAAV